MLETAFSHLTQLWDVSERSSLLLYPS